ncbi:MAG TPA: endonuclease domain-containing protein [Micromonospora sp.]
MAGLAYHCQTRGARSRASRRAGGACAVCGDPDPQHVDHDHRTGWVRGILCFNCNGGLGRSVTVPCGWPGRSRI